MSDRTELSRPLVVVANRLPVSLDEDGDWEPSAGGLVTAMRPVVGQVGGAWIGWDGNEEEEVPERVEGLNVDLHPVGLSHAEVQGYYYGFANRTVWPLFHDHVIEPVIDRSWWESYERVNRTFADATADVLAGADTDPLVWVQDYHLMLLPELLRGDHPDAKVGFFLHIPFPPPELLARLPWREEILRGLLGADLIGFHTEYYRDNFCRSVTRILDAPIELDDDGVMILPDGREVRTTASGISIDVDQFADLARHPDTAAELEELREQFRGRKVFLGVDRVDYTKGIRHRLEAIQELLRLHPDLAERFAFVQIGVPSREDVREYQELRDEIERTVGHINGQFTEPAGDVPVHYLYRSVSQHRLVAYYLLADVMCITPLKDGMNLVAKEFVTAQDAAGGDGVLLLSEFTGAIIELGGGAVRCNPFDVEGMAAVMADCLDLEPDDRRERMRRMGRTVRGHDVFRWVDEQLGALDGLVAG